MLDEICKEVKELSEDQYGNYIIQYILEHNKGNNVENEDKGENEEKNIEKDKKDIKDNKLFPKELQSI